MDHRTPLHSALRRKLSSTIYDNLYDCWIAWTYGEQLPCNAPCIVRCFPKQNEQFIIICAGLDTINETSDPIVYEASVLGYKVEEITLTHKSGKIFDDVDNEDYETEGVYDVIIISSPTTDGSCIDDEGRCAYCVHEEHTYSTA